MNPATRVLVHVMAAPRSPTAARHVLRRHATIFMLHRFADPEREVAGMESWRLRRMLTELRRKRYELLSLTEVFRRLADDEAALRGAVAFTIDDGYLEQATVAAPVFAELDCPVTTFVTTGFLDGSSWLWWDQIEYAFQRTERRSVEIRIGDAPLSLTWRDGAERDRAETDVVSRCKRVANAARLDAVAELMRALDVELPSAPPDKYAPMSWDQLRACERAGMTFGPHTVTHPILSRTTDVEAEEELRGSWERLRAEAERPVPVFCYPNGGWGDFGAREVQLLQALGLTGAVAAESGYAGDRHPVGGIDGFAVPRFALPATVLEAANYVTGAHRLTRGVRRLLR